MKTTTKTSRSPICERLEDRQMLSTTIFADNFEGGNKGWTNDTYLSTDSRAPWTIGAVKGGPGVAHSGTHVAATTNPGDDAVLASPAINLPAVNQYQDHLYLKWSEWTDFSSRGGFGASMPVVREYIPDLGGWGPWNVIDPNTDPAPQQTKTWATTSLDLTQFAGEKVQIGFHDYGMRNGAPGWYIDDVSVVQTAIQNPWTGDTSFENGFADWSTTDGMWDVGTATGITAPTGTKVAGTGLASNPTVGLTSSLVSPAFYLPASAANKPVSLSFKSYLTGTAIMTVEWQYWMPSVGWSPVQNISADTSEVVLNEFQPANKWTTMNVPLTESLSGAHTLPVRLLFTAGAGGGRGWFIDDVKLNFTGKPIQPSPTPSPSPTPTSKVAHVAVSNQFGSLTSNVTSVFWGTQKLSSSAMDLVFTVKNTGTATLTLGQVILDKPIGFSVAKQPAMALAAGAVTTFTIRISRSSVGHKSATVHFLTNDPSVTTFKFNISGDVFA